MAPPTDAVIEGGMMIDVWFLVGAAAFGFVLLVVKVVRAIQHRRALRR